MNEQQLLERIRNHANSVGIADAKEITLESPLGQTRLEGNDTPPVGFDSLEIIELSMKLEDELDKTCTEDELQKIKTVGDLVNHFKN